MVQRDLYMKEIIPLIDNELIKVITGIRRCGKSYLLRTIFRDYLLEHGVTPDQIITIELDTAKDIEY
ncbi:MAG: AAA family ATPase, partial [Methanobrevibacter sp.]|nr:AAA family ATPase [Methanobrevibacter sp.]